MAEKNGIWQRVTLWLIGICITAILIPVLFNFNCMILANDRESRARDTGLQEELSNSIIAQKNVDEIQTVAITNMRTEVMTELKYISKKLEKL